MRGFGRVELSESPGSCLRPVKDVYDLAGGILGKVVEAEDVKSVLESD